MTNNLCFPGSFGGDSCKIGYDTRLEWKICRHVYEPDQGDDYWQILPGTPFSQLPEHWTCPQCDGKKIDIVVDD